MNDMPLPGPLDEFLHHPPTTTPAPERQATLLRLTSAALRRRHRAVRLRQRLLAVAAMLVLALTAKLAYTWIFAEQSEPTPMEPVARQEPAPVVPKQPAPPPARQNTAAALEWQAFDAPRPQQAALYVQAGNRYVEEQRDLGSAVRCYGQALHTEPTVEIDMNDNWLVLAMKLDERERRKEK